MLAEYLGYDVVESHVDKLYQTASDEKYAVAFSLEKPLHCTLTLHSSKGLEFEQVILFIEDYAFFGTITKDHINNHYVACTRARSKLIIVDTGTLDAVTVKENMACKFKTANVEPKQLITVLQ